MITIELDGKKIPDRESLHRIFIEKLNLEDYYGCNLDALYDVLSTYSKEVVINIVNADDLCSDVPSYGDRLIGMLNVAAEENEPYIIVNVDDSDYEEDYSEEFIIDEEEDSFEDEIDDEKYDENEEDYFEDDNEDEYEDEDDWEEE